MKDKEIRNILIAYLKVKHEEVRIYQEKSIGSAICDVMAVTDKLTGYEIKSDGDNYQRLERQIEFYDKFFDENYIVVSQKHIASAENKVPKHWGIIYIDNNEVKISRNAKNNYKVSRRSQLMGTSPYGNIKRIVNFLKRFSKTVKEELENIEKSKKEYDEAKISLSLPNEHYDKLLKCKQELEELMRVAERNKLVDM